METQAQRKARLTLAPLIVIYILGLALFYFKYVPLVTRFQITLLPLLAAVLLVTAARAEWGLLVFIFVFPLINNLPYLFGIFENVPHAPTALVLFLFYFLGLLVHKLVRGDRLSFREPIVQPLAWFSITIVASGIITALRYASPYPFLGTPFFELRTNVAGVSSGGAVMSVLFFSLNYLTGMAFFFAFLDTARSRAFIKKTLIVLGLSAFVSLSFGLFQHLKSIKIGSSPLTIGLGLINATFKDALSFGAFLAMIVSLAFGVGLAFRGLLRLSAFLLALFSMYMVLFSGSKSGFLSIPLSLLLFAILSVMTLVRLIRAGSVSWRKLNWATFVIAGLVMTAAIAGILSKSYIQKEILTSQTFIRTHRTIMGAKSDIGQEWLKSIFRDRAESLWKMAGLMMKDYPLTGVGIGGYIIEVSNYAKLHPTELNPQSAENYLLQVGSELGPVGIFLVLWILWEIVKLAGRSYSRVPPTDPYRFILIGALGGIASFLLMLQTHTFIGSYEIKYFFWLLVGIVFGLGRAGGREDEDPGRRPLFSTAQKIAGVVVISLFSGALFWNSTRSLSLRSRTEKFGFKQDFGFYPAENTNAGKTFRWTREYGGSTMKVAKPVIGIPLLVSHPDVQQKPVKVRIYLFEDFFEHRQLLAEVTIDRSTWKTYEYEVPREVGKEVILLVTVSRTWNPLKVMGAPDPRNLGVAVGKIEFRDALFP
jgi:hypothetical protein